MKRVLVTGASGFLGYPLVAALARNGYDVRAAVRRMPTRVFPSDVQIVTHPDFVDLVDWPSLVTDVDAVVHLAGIAHMHKGVPDSDYDRINHIATAEIAAAAKRAGVRRFVYISSIRAQCGAMTTVALNESCAPRPTDAYGRSKLAGEAAVCAADLPFTILRPALVFGPGAKGNIRTLLRLASLPLPLPFGALSNRRSLLSLENFITAVSFALNSRRVIDELYVVADAAPLSIAEIVAALRRGLGRDAGVFSLSPRLLRAALVSAGLSSTWERIGEALVVDASKLVGAGWTPNNDTSAALSRMAASFATTRSQRRAQND
jgi:UDP-glucose 4-epimerase